MTGWLKTARKLIDAGMSVNDASRQVGKSEYAIRLNLNINGRGDAYEAKKLAAKKDRPESSRGTPRPAPRPKTVTLAPVNLGPEPVAEAAPERKLRPRISVRIERPGVARIREIHQRMIRQGKIAPGRDLLSEWRS